MKPKLLFAVMKAHQWSALKVNGCALVAPEAGPNFFIPVFDTRAKAVKWAGSNKHIAVLTTQDTK